MKKIENKRYTWNKIRKEEYIKKVEEKRSKWKYVEPTVPIRTRLN